MKKKLQGVVFSNKMIGTLVVSVEIRKPDPKYKKVIKKHRKFKVSYDPSLYNFAIGETVYFEETRHISKTVSHCVVERKQVV